MDLNRMTVEQSRAYGELMNDTLLEKRDVAERMFNLGYQAGLDRAAAKAAVAAPEAASTPIDLTVKPAKVSAKAKR